MKYIGFLYFVALALVTVAMTDAPARSPDSGRTFVLGFLASGSRPASHSAGITALEALYQSLDELGYRKGRNLEIEERWADSNRDRLPALAAELVELEVDVIVASSASAVRAAKRATREIPIVIAGAADPVAGGLVESLSHPGANVTGVSGLPGRELEGKRLELLREAVPGLARVGVILDSTGRIDPEPLEAAASQMDIVLLQSGESESPEEFRDSFSDMVRERADAIYAPETPINVRQRQLIVELALEHRLPAIYGSSEFVEAGGLMAYGPSFVELFRRVALYVDRILKGADPRELPVEQPMRLELVINKRTADYLGGSSPPTIIVRADKTIQ